MGTTVNLIEAWEPYKAAKAALSNILQTANIKQISQKYLESLKVSNLKTAYVNGANKHKFYRIVFGKSY